MDTAVSSPAVPPGSGPVLLVDTYSLFFRAHHALPPMNTASGAPTSALYGFCTALLRELRERRPRALAFAVDAAQKTFRHESYPAYKGTRDAVPSAIVAQFGRLRELLAAFGVPVFTAPGYEADDILATLAARFRAEQTPVLVMSGDRDLMQLAHGGVAVLFLGARGQKPVVMAELDVEQRFAVAPEKLPAFAALVGDSSDNLPGVPGVGPRTAAKWVTEHGSVAAILESVEALEPKRLRDVVRAHAEQIRLNERLATLTPDVPLGDELLAAPLQPEAIGALEALFIELEFKSLIARLRGIAVAAR
jgi:DNA polymerase-1